MSFVLMEDLKPYPSKRQPTIVHSIRIIRPLVKLARLTYRSSRLIIRQCVRAFQKVFTRKNAAESTIPQTKRSNEIR